MDEGYKTHLKEKWISLESVIERCKKYVVAKSFADFQIMEVLLGFLARKVRVHQ
jgi:hypothetical protein